MDKKQLTDINRKLHEQLKEQIKVLIADVDVEAIHKLRVLYKKLRAFLRMLAQQKGSAGCIKISNSIKNSFKIAGSIRDIQLQQKRILQATKNKEIKKPILYLSILQKESDQLKKELLETAVTSIVTKNCKKTTALLPDKFSIKRFRKFLHQQWGNIDAIILSDNLSDENIHTIRKSIKDIFFNLKIYEKTKHGMLTNTIWRGKNEANFSDLLVELGNFQDKCMGISFLKIKGVNNLNKHNKAQLIEIKKRWLKEKAVIKKALVLHLKNELLAK